MSARIPAKPETQPDEELSDLIARFEDQNEELLTAMRVFGVTNAEYERAIRALYGASISTVASTEPEA